jgi:hypothetical protein
MPVLIFFAVLGVSYLAYLTTNENPRFWTDTQLALLKKSLWGKIGKPCREVEPKRFRIAHDKNKGHGRK